jgi:hypothetical protein
MGPIGAEEENASDSRHNPALVVRYDFESLEIRARQFANTAAGARQRLWRIPATQEATTADAAISLVKQEPAVWTDRRG